MWYQGQLYMADSYDDEMEMIVRFCEDDNYNSMLIIDPDNRIDVYKDIRGNIDYDFDITWFNNDSMPSNNRKTIFVNNVFDRDAQKFVSINYSIVAFF